MLSLLKECQGKLIELHRKVWWSKFHCFKIHLVLGSLSVVVFLTRAKKSMAGRYRETPSCPRLPPPSPSLHCQALSLAQSLSARSSEVLLCTCWACPHPGPLFGLSFFLSQRTPRGLQGPVARLPGHLTEAVLSHRKACGVPG